MRLKGFLEELGRRQRDRLPSEEDVEGWRSRFTAGEAIARTAGRALEEQAKHPR
ncbi:MAG: hypothetical protein JRN40_02860 [Nitrososphaerota archaeon]|nr:hypothetical protein [Nitrososphaerota archaeon]